MKEKDDKNFYIFLITMIVLSIFWFKLDLGEGYNIVYFSVFSAGIGFFAGKKLNKS